MKFLLGIVTGLVIVAAAGAFVIASGAFPVAATIPPSGLEKSVATLAVRRSVAKRAPRAENPVKAAPDVLAKGLAHYRSMCLTCHKDIATKAAMTALARLSESFKLRSGSPVLSV